MNEAPLYEICADAPKELALRLEQRSPAAAPRLRTVITGQVTEEEYRAIFGPEARMQDHICRETYGHDDYTIRIFLADVLACEGGLNSVQARLINSALRSAGKEPLDEGEMNRRARDYGDISLSAAEELLDAADAWLGHDGFDAQAEWERLRTAGITLADLLREEQS